MDDRLKMMLLLNSVNANAAALAKFLLRGAEPRELWNPAKTDVAQEVFSEKSLAKIRAANDAAWAERELERAGKLGARLLTVDDGEQTRALMDMLLAKKRASDRKAWLETKGDLASLEV